MTIIVPWYGVTRLEIEKWRPGNSFHSKSDFIMIMYFRGGWVAKTVELLHNKKLLLAQHFSMVLLPHNKQDNNLQLFYFLYLPYSSLVANPIHLTFLQVDMVRSITIIITC